MARDRPPASHCPVCDAPLVETQLASAAGARELPCCESCGWPIANPDAATDLDRTRERWARDLWQRSQQNLAIEARLEASVSRLETAIAAFPASVPTEPETEPNEEIPLDSDLGLGYSPLAWALSAGDWRSANQLTQELVDEAIARNAPADPASHALTLARSSADAAQFLDDIARFPATDLHTLAWLWGAYSEGRLGFAAQASQWTGSYEDFCDRVGWHGARGWLYIDALQFDPVSIEELPIGHFPVLAWRKRACYGIGGQTAANLMAAWLDRWQEVSEAIADELSEELNGGSLR